MIPVCGIAGTVGYPRNRVQLALDAMIHRGPDCEGIWNDGEVKLGHRRLSILDL